MGPQKTGIFVFSPSRKIPFPFPVLLLAAVNGNRAGIRLTIIWIFRKILETDRIKTRKLFQNFQNFPDFLALFAVVKMVFREQLFPIVPRTSSFGRSKLDPDSPGLDFYHPAAYRFNTIRFQYYSHTPP
jgi:hypothetical protein